MRTRFRDLSIRSKLAWASVLVSVTALAAASVSFLLYDRHTMREQMVRMLDSRSDIIADAASAAVTFAVPEDAAKTLATLRADPHVLAGAIYDAEGRLFASYVRPDAPIDLPPLLGHRDVSTTMIYTHVLNRGALGAASPADRL